MAASGQLISHCLLGPTFLSLLALSLCNREDIPGKTKLLSRGRAECQKTRDKTHKDNDDNNLSIWDAGGPKARNLLSRQCLGDFVRSSPFPSWSCLDTCPCAFPHFFSVFTGHMLYLFSSTYVPLTFFISSFPSCDSIYFSVIFSAQQQR